MTKSAGRGCRRCGGVLAAREGAGRPSSYCGRGCKLSVEHEVRRVEGALGRAEGRLSGERLRAARVAADPHGMEALLGVGPCRPVPEFWEAEVVRLEGRLRVLLGEGPCPVPGVDDRVSPGPARGRR